MSYETLRGSEPRGAQTYSVYNYRTKQFDYFEMPLGIVPASGRFRKPIGNDSPEKLALHLPEGAQFVGSGDAPMGIISSHPSMMLGAVVASGRSKWGVYAAIGVGLIAANTALRKKSKKYPKAKKSQKGGFFSFLWGKK